jgi:mono/diheme cytochrome c family protein
MKRTAHSISAGLCAAFLIAAIVGARAEEEANAGKTEYLQNCVGCHGADGKGADPQSAGLKVKPADLTLLAKRNHGVFDKDAVYQMIDGRNVRQKHRNSEMPIWGCRHDNPAVPVPPAAKNHRKPPKRVVSAMRRRENELDSLLDLPCGSEQAIRERILSIVDYLSLLQVK